VIAVVKDDRGAAIQMLYIRGGKLIGQRQYVLDGAADAPPSEAVQEFVKQYYADAPEVPREILLPLEIEERHIVQSWLRQRKGSAVTIEVPQTGEKARLVDLAAANAEQALNSFSQELQRKEAWADEAMSQLQDSIGLAEPPVRVEGYDISNIQGTAPVGSMVVTEGGEPAKAEYRRFKIRYHPESPNDFAMMHEVITRRLKSYLDGDEKFLKLPNLMMIDGGKGQLSAALKARDELGLTVPMVGLAKRHELLYVPLDDDQFMPLADLQTVVDEEYSYRRKALREYAFREVELPLNSPGLLLLRKLRDEAHRFALTYHRKIRDKRMNGSAIEEIPGIGPRRKRLLLRTFGSVEAIRRASVEEIAAVPTMTKTLAAKVREYLVEV
jgi:excinuclease ABC subunit C